jgi:hypothetical protein
MLQGFFVGRERKKLNAIAGTWPQYGPIGPWISASAYGMILGSFMLSRFSSKLSVVSGPWSVVDTVKPQLTTDN